MDFDKRIVEIFLDLPEVPPEPPAISHVVQAGKLVIISGALPWKEGRMLHKGRLGLELNVDAGRQASHAACVQALAMLNKFLQGSLNKIKKIVMLRGFVASGAEFYDQNKVLDSASQLLLDVFGSTTGRHARSAVGVNALPHGAAVELELVVEVK